MPKKDSLGVRTVAGALMLGAADEVARVSLAGSGLPHSLVAGASAILGLSLARGYGRKFHERWLAPGSVWLLTWMAAFFAPNLVLLPLAQPVASGLRDLAGVFFVTFGGLIATLLATGFATAFFEEKTAKVNPTDSYFSSLENQKRAKVKLSSKPFGPLVYAASATVASFLYFLATFSPFAATCFFASSTIAAYILGVRTNHKILAWKDNASFLKSAVPKNLFFFGEKGGGVSTASLKKASEAYIGLFNKYASRVLSKIAHPVVLCAALVVFGAVNLASFATGISPRVALELYASTGGAALQRFLGPCVVALACGVYGRRHDIMAAFRSVFAGVFVGSVVGTFGTALLVNALSLPAQAKLALLPRCITSPLALPILEALGGDPAAAFAIIVVTGIAGAAFGPAVLTKVNINSPKARGLAMGLAAHGIGTAQMANEPPAQPYASIGMAVGGATMVALALFKPTQTLLLKAAGL